MSKRLTLRNLLLKGKTGIQAAREAGYAGSDDSLTQIASREKRRLEREQGEVAVLSTTAAVRRTREILDSRHAARFDQEAVYGALRDSLVLWEHVARTNDDETVPSVNLIFADAEKVATLCNGGAAEGATPNGNQ